jgi:hypothetical protein
MDFGAALLIFAGYSLYMLGREVWDRWARK